MLAFTTREDCLPPYMIYRLAAVIQPGKETIHTRPYSGSTRNGNEVASNGAIGCECWPELSVVNERGGPKVDHRPLQSVHGEIEVA
jgi:hypothetical protein